MTGAGLQTQNEVGLGDRLNAIYVYAVFIFLPLFAHAGGLAIAILAAIGGIVAILTGPKFSLKTLPPWGMALTVFCLWVFVSSFWSPYDDPNGFSNPLKFIIGVPLYIAFAYGIARARDVATIRFNHILMAMAVMASGWLLIDLLSNYGLTLMIDPLNDGEIINNRISDANMNVGHAITVWVLLLAPVIYLMANMLKYGKVIAGLYVLSLLTAAYLSQLSVGLMGIIAVLVAMGLAKVLPRTTILILLAMAVAAIVLAPLMGIISGALPESATSALPFSWEHRVTMWDYTASRIWESPIWGHGFDAVRTFEDTFSARGFEDLNIIWLHPHSAGLHIWVETGFIGALLAALTLGLLGHELYQEIGNDPKLAVPVAGYVAATILICTVTYGVWQEWWWGSLIIAAATLDLCVGAEKTA